MAAPAAALLAAPGAQHVVAQRVWPLPPHDPLQTLQVQEYSKLGDQLLITVIKNNALRCRIEDQHGRIPTCVITRLLHNIGSVAIQLADLYQVSTYDLIVKALQHPTNQHLKVALQNRSCDMPKVLEVASLLEVTYHNENLVNRANANLAEALDTGLTDINAVAVIICVSYRMSRGMTAATGHGLNTQQTAAMLKIFVNQRELLDHQKADLVGCLVQHQYYDGVDVLASSSQVYATQLADAFHRMMVA